MHSSATAALVALLLAVPITAHSWVEEMDVIDPKTGLFTGSPGYCRNNTKRTVPGFSDPQMVHILPGDGQPAIEERQVIAAVDTTGIKPTDTMCKQTQQAQFQSEGSPRLQAAPGSLVSLRYQENGHVTLPHNQPGKPANRGTVYIYGTTQPKTPEIFLDVFGQWTADGSGGDKRGRLLATQPFDDNRCYQVNSGNISSDRQAQYPHTADQLMGANLWCQNNILLAADVPTGTYTLYWVWDWPTEAGVDPNLPKGKAEVYTTCMDIDIVAKPGRKRRVKARQQPSSASPASMNLNSAAIPAYLSSLTASPAPAGASPAVSAQAGAASPNSIPANPTAPVAGSNSNTAGVASYIESAVSVAIAAQIPKTVTVDIVESVVLPTTAAIVAATQAASPAAAAASNPAAMPANYAPTASPAAAAASTPAAAPANNAPAATQAASEPAASTPTPAQAQAPAPSSMPPKSLEINPPILSGSSPAFSGTASPAVRATSVAAAGAPESSSAPVIVSGTSQNGTTPAKRGCNAKTCQSKRQSRIFGAKSGGHRRL